LESNLFIRALNLSYFTIVYNVFEGILSILAGLIAGSSSLLGFGLDSVIESLSATILVWRFRKAGKISDEEEEKVEKRALQYVGYTFLIIGIYVLYESIIKLYTGEIPNPSLLGILIAIASIIVMPILYYMKYKTGKSLKSKSLIADSKQTLACMYLSIALLFGLLSNYIYGIWQADPIVGILIAIYLLKEGYVAIIVK
jgi:divalent metal cation (Fe/Co/Zn/Cd) transporter